MYPKFVPSYRMKGESDVRAWKLVGGSEKNLLVGSLSGRTNGPLDRLSLNTSPKIEKSS
jgi:hypothetical protein